MIKQLNAIRRRFFSEELKTLYKADFINGDNELTDKGREALEVIALDHFMEELVEEAEEAIEEEKEE